MRAFLPFLILVVFSYCLKAQQLAFPTAEGYGKYTKGGRGGDVYLVTNLKDRGKGSLRAAIEAQGPRTVVFRISGNIELESPLKIEHPFITIAGQTAPGDGICIKNHQLSIAADHVIIRYIRVRPGDVSGKDYDAITGRYQKNIILDHVSASWSVDECVSIYRCDSVTIQWCIISESLFGSNHIKGHHGFGGIWGNNYSTYHHNLFAHHSSRNPRWSSGGGFNDYRNNVIYNWGYNSCYGGESVEDSYPDRYNFFIVNMIANYYKSGPATMPGEVSWRIAAPSINIQEELNGQWFIANNVVKNYDKVSIDNWEGGVQFKEGNMAIDRVKLVEPWPAMPISEQSAIEAYQLVIDRVGAILPNRDVVDSRIVGEVITGNANYEGVAYKKIKKVKNSLVKCGIIDSQNDVGGWPFLNSSQPPMDIDHDGMPDFWEEENNLDKENPEDRNTKADDGYTMLEIYLNSICK